MASTVAQFRPGQLIHHKLFAYRGVVVDVDPVFQGSDESYEAMAGTRPPKDAPWYHVLVHGRDDTTYVAERNLEPDYSMKPIRHPQLGAHFERFTRGAYVPRRPTN